MSRGLPDSREYVPPPLHTPTATDPVFLFLKGKHNIFLMTFFCIVIGYFCIGIGKGHKRK